MIAAGIARSARAHARALTGLVWALFVGLAACSDSDPSDPGTPGPSSGDLLLVTSIPDHTGQDGSSFIQTVGLDQAEITNADAFEQTFIPYAFIHGDDVIVTQHLVGDQAVRYVRGADGKLTEAGRMSLPPGGMGANVVYASPTKAYLSVSYDGKIIVFNPQTMEQVHEIDLTALDVARNAANPDDRNPEPAVMHLRDGKLYVALQQLVGGGFTSADGVDILIIDTATDQFEKVIHDARAASPGRIGYNPTMFVDEQGDLYVVTVASWGFVPGQKAGVLRIRHGETEFDPDYFVNITDTELNVPGGRITFLNTAQYGRDGYLYGIAEVPALMSDPPRYATDRAYQAVRVHLATGDISVLPLQASTGLAAGGVTLHGGTVIFGLSTSTGTGLYTYDPVTGQASDAPVVATAGDPTLVLAFE